CPVPSCLWTVAVGTLCLVWFTGTGFCRMTTYGAVSGFPIPTPNAFPANIAVGPDRQIWFTEQTANSLGRITRHGKVSELAVPTPHSALVGLTAGSDRRPPDLLVDKLYFAEQGGNKLGYIDFGDGSNADDG